VEILYAWSSGGCDATDIPSLLSDRMQQRQRRDQDRDYLDESVRGVISNIEVLDQVIREALQEKGSLRIGAVERSILRLGVWELMFRPDVPYRVIINEALQLTRTYADENARCFVNGILDKLARKIRNPKTNAVHG